MSADDEDLAMDIAVQTIRRTEDLSEAVDQLRQAERDVLDYYGR